MGTTARPQVARGRRARAALGHRPGRIRSPTASASPSSSTRRRCTASRSTSRPRTSSSSSAGSRAARCSGAAPAGPAAAAGSSTSGRATRPTRRTSSRTSGRSSRTRSAGRRARAGADHGREPGGAAGAHSARLIRRAGPATDIATGQTVIPGPLGSVGRGRGDGSVEATNLVAERDLAVGQDPRPEPGPMDERLQDRLAEQLRPGTGTARTAACPRTRHRRSGTAGRRARSGGSRGWSTLRRVSPRREHDRRPALGKRLDLLGLDQRDVAIDLGSPE